METAMQNLLFPKTGTRIGTWNGRALYEAGKFED